MTRIQTKLPLGANRFTTPIAGLILIFAISTCLCFTNHGHHHQQHHPHHNHHEQHQQHSPAQSHADGAHPQNTNHMVAPQQHQPTPNGGSPADHSPPSNSGKMLATGALIGATSTAAIAAAASAVLPHHHEQGQQQEAQGNLRPTRQLMSEKTFVDLSHPLHNGTLHWPTFGDINYSVTNDGERHTKQGQTYYLKADSLSAAIHSGTHVDAPRHFSKTGWTVDQIPLDRLIDVPLTVIDVSAKVKANRTYSFVKEDFLKPNSDESLVQANSVVLVYTGISQFYDQGKEAYLGTNSSDISEMKIPGFSEEAANYMCERGVYGVGIDSLSADSSDRHGSDGLDSYDPVAHNILTAKNIYIIENISKRLAELVNVQGARLTTAPLPIVGGSGSQVRVVAILGHDEDHCEQQAPRNGDGGQYANSCLTFIISLFLCLAIFLF